MLRLLLATFLFSLCLKISASCDAVGAIDCGKEYETNARRYDKSTVCSVYFEQLKKCIVRVGCTKEVTDLAIVIDVGLKSQLGYRCSSSGGSSTCADNVQNCVRVHQPRLAEINPGASEERKRAACKVVDEFKVCIMGAGCDSNDVQLEFKIMDDMLSQKGVHCSSSSLLFSIGLLLFMIICSTVNPFSGY